jgi:hypothetical protein
MASNQPSKKSARKSARTKTSSSRMSARRKAVRPNDPAAILKALALKVATLYPELADRALPHFREPRRRPSTLKANISLMLADGTVYDSGTAVITNLSSAGALLADVNLAKGAFPVAAFTINVQILSKEYAGIGLICRPVRFAPESCGVGVRFEEAFVAM